MVIFLAGVHGVGKTFLGRTAADLAGLTYASASSLIREEMRAQNWDSSKRVRDAPANQEALIRAIDKLHREHEAMIVLDGHFVLRGEHGDYVRLPIDVFQRLNLCGVILLDSSVDTILNRLRARGGFNPPREEVLSLQREERDHVEKICSALKIPVEHLLDPNIEAVSVALRTFLDKATRRPGM